MEKHVLQNILEKIDENPIFVHQNITISILQIAASGKNATIVFKNEEEQIVIQAFLYLAIQPKDISKLSKFRDEESTIVIAQYITGEARKQLEHLRIFYLDLAGNAFIILKRKDKGTYSLHSISKVSTRAILTKSGDRAFGKTGLKLVYYFLLNPEGINYPYRKIASHTNIAIDTIGKVIKHLLREGYLVKKDKKKYLFRNRPTLFDKWVEEYNRVLRPKLIRSEVGAIEEIDWDNPRTIKDSSWGGMVAYNKSNIDSSQLIVNKAILYTKGEHFDLMHQEQLMPRNNGPITLYTAFWNIEEGHENYVHPFLVYADLIDSNDPRQIEAAQEIYEKEIEPQL